MVKSDLALKLAETHTDTSAEQVSNAVNSILNLMTDTLIAEDRVEIRGFGAFSVAKSAPRKGRNPKTGESVDVAAKTKVHFKPGKAMRDRVNTHNL